jgi:pyridoxamine 5'-phosphate oxidase
MKNNLADIRKEYLKGHISVETMPENPLDALQTWVNQAIEAEVEEPTAMSICTVSKNNVPSSRQVLLKEIRLEGLVFYTNYNSRKGHEIENNPNVALNFFWPTLERQVRVQCIASKISEEESDTYFYSRPKASQVGAIVSNQSSIIASDLNLEAEIERILEGNVEINRPENWGGYILKPNYFEFWHGRSSRVHDRVSYQLEENNKWTKNRLSP